MKTKLSRWTKTLIFALLVAAIIGILAWLGSFPADHPPIPDDAKHSGLTEWHRCLDCHAPGKISPTKPSHPLSNQKCFRCHASARAQAPGR